MGIEKQENAGFRPRDLVPVYGIIKDVSEHKDWYLKPIKELPDNLVANLSLKVSLLYAYNFGIIVGLSDGLKKIINGC